VETIILKSLIFVALVLAWLGFLMFVVILASIIETKPARSKLKQARQRHTPGTPAGVRMVTATPAISPDLPASVSPHPSVRVPIQDDEVLYAQVERFDDPEGDL
jgi:hypothetical protein